MRLVELSFGAGPTLNFGARHAVVATGDENRSTVAEAIARAVIGPRSAAIDGTVEIAGRLVVLQSLPAPLLRPDAPAVVDRDALDSLWQDLSTHRRGELEAEHAAQRFEGHRIDAAIDRERERIRRTSRTPPVPVVEPPAPEPVVVMDDTARREAERVREQLASLLAKYDTLTPIPSPHAVALAAEFDSLGSAAPVDVVEVDDAGIAAAERRVALARAAVETTRGGIAPDARTRIETAHRAVVEAERAVHEASRKQRSQAEARYAAAIAEERAALADAGVESYATFLMGIIASVLPADGEAAERAARELAEAEAALAAAKAAAAIPASPASPASPAGHDPDVELRARAASILGHFPGDDPATELRAVRVEDPLAATLRDAMGTALADAGRETGDDVVATARAELQRPLPPVEERIEPAPEPVPAAPVAPAAVESQDEGSPELDALLREREAITRRIADLEQKLDAFSRQRGLSFSAVDGAGAGAVLDALLERYRTAQLLAGRLPLVVDGALDALSPDATAGIVGALAAADDVQVIVVTANEAVGSALAAAGAVPLRWPGASAPVAEPHAPRTREPEPEPEPLPAPEPVAQVAPAPVEVHADAQRPASDPFTAITEATSAMCARHGDVAEAARCAHCGRSCCIDCLVYTTADNAVWCVDCAETLQARNLRLLRRRGA